jgi:hypothetical protein
MQVGPVVNFGKDYPSQFNVASSFLLLEVIDPVDN